MKFIYWYRYLMPWKWKRKVTFGRFEMSEADKVLIFNGAIKEDGTGCAAKDYGIQPKDCLCALHEFQRKGAA